MQTMANLTTADWAKISTDLRWSLEQAARFPNWRVRDLEGGIPFLTGLWTAGIPGIFGGGIRSDIYITHADGMRYHMLDVDIPEQWTGRMWTDFVVGIVRSPWVLDAGTIREWPVLGWQIQPEGSIRVSSPHEMAMIAGRAPARAATPQPVIQPPPPPPFRPQHPLQPQPVPQQPFQPQPADGGPVQRIAGTLGVSPTVLAVGGVAVAGLLVLALVLARRPAPVKPRRRR